MTYETANPNPRALIESLRSVGYSLQTAIADIIDNSVTAKADNVWITFHWGGKESSISILDDGAGMSEAKLFEAMRPGTLGPAADREHGDLGRFGLGLKTASFSQCRRLTVWSKCAGAAPVGRRWDLDFVVATNEWALEKDLDKPIDPAFSMLEGLSTGTLVIWTKLDALVGGTDIGAEEHQRGFHGQMDDVRQYLAMIFHRYIEGVAAVRRGPLQLWINGSRLEGWDPFNVSDKVAPEWSPIEEIPYKGQTVTIRGCVLPHKDRLTEKEYREGSGPKGWLAQQGFYIYRNDRLLLAGDWLRLGRGGRAWTQEEQYKLARLSIDFASSLDRDWSLDVKKSTARPPAALRERLTGLAESIRKRAKEVFISRGFYGPRPTTRAVVNERPWKSVTRSERTVYQVNREHPMVKGVLRELGPLAAKVEAILRLVEETVPVQRIWIDTAESEKDHAIPYEGLSDQQVRADIQFMYDLLRKAGSDHDTAVTYLRSSEPFNRYPHLVELIRS